MSLLLATSLFVLGVFSQPAGDLITNLPGLTFNINYKQYSGYLNISSGHHLHYWFQESQNDPANDPVVLWLNGGPGCSSLDGLLYEQGAIHVYDNATLWANPYAWNLNTSVLFLEAPICVGFSFQDGSPACHSSDNATAADNYLALLEFFNLFPIYTKNQFFVTGESYGGVYVPTLTLNILQGNAAGTNEKINLIGFAVGNGVTKRNTMDNGLQWFYYHHGMYSESEWNAMQSACCPKNEPFTRYNCDFDGGSTQCQTAVNNAQSKCCHDLNRYNIYGECYQNSDGSIDQNAYERLNAKNELYSWDKYVRHMRYTYGDDYADKLEGVPGCLDAKGATTYLNQMNVKAALHVKSNIHWSICSNDLTYTGQYGDMSATYKAIFEMDSSIYATVYNGDTDTSCNFLGDQWFVDDLGLSESHTWREWYITDVNGQQVGGWTKDFKGTKGNIHFVTVRGSGHMVPQYRPVAALKMFNAFIANQDFKANLRISFDSQTVMFKRATRIIIIKNKRTFVVIGRYYSSIISPKSNPSKCPFVSGSNAGNNKSSIICPFKNNPKTTIAHYSQNPISSSDLTLHPLYPKRDGLDTIETTEWRYPQGPFDYTEINATYLKERMASWNDPNCLENVVSNIVKTLEMEVTHKTNAKQFVSIVPEKFRYKANDGDWVSTELALAEGLYNVLLNNAPKHLYDTNQTFDESHTLFHDTFTNGFIWEVLKVYSGPPNVGFSWRHWGAFDGVYNGNSGNGDVINVYGFCTANVKMPGDGDDDPYVRVEEFQVWYDAEKFLSELNGIDNKSVVDTAFGIGL